MRMSATVKYPGLRLRNSKRKEVFIKSIYIFLFIGVISLLNKKTLN